MASDTEEEDRLRTLRRYAVLDTPPEPNFDRLTTLAATVFDTPVSTLSLADADRHWFKSRVGVEAREIPRNLSFCDETIRGTSVFVVGDALADARFCDAPVVAEAPHLRFYAGAPLITPEGRPIGALCVLDTAPKADFSGRKMRILADLADTAVEMLEARSRQIELSEATRAIAHLARHDPLTGLANRRNLAERLDEAIARHGADASLALLALDLDGFKAVNDRHGHPVGDELLRLVARRLEAVGGSAISLCRLGGDEFAILLAGAGDLRSRAADLAGRLLQVIAKPYAVGARTLMVGVSIGIVVSLCGEASLDALLQDGDVALYRAKAQGRGRFVFADRLPPERRFAVAV